MSDKEMDLGAVTEVPDDPLMEGFRHSVDFQEGIEKALAEVERGETHTVEEVREMMKEWVRK